MNYKIKKFLSYYKPHLGLFMADILCASFISATTLAFPLCTREITRGLLEISSSPHLYNEVYFMASIMILLLFIHICCKFFVDYKGHIMGMKIESNMRLELFEHYQKLSFSFYDEHKTGQLMTRITNDLLNISELYHHGPEDLIISILNFFGAFIIMSFINLQLTVIVFSFLMLMMIYSFYFNKKMNVSIRKGKDKIEDINSQVEDTLAGHRVVKSFSNEKIEFRKFSSENNLFMKSKNEYYKYEAYFYLGITSFTQMMSIVVVVFGSIQVLNRSLVLAELLPFLLCINILIEPINRFSNFVKLYQEGMTGFDRFLEMLQIKPDIQDEIGAVELSNIKGDIEFKNIGFQYKKNEKHILKNVSLKINAGDYVAFVGPSGVGKTTLCSLIPRFYEITEGKILLDGIDIKSISLKSLRDSIGFVQQDTYLFAGTVIENIKYGQLNSTHEEIIEAAKKANAHDFIMQLPQEYETVIGQRGVKLSGGQRQKLSIARVFLKNPPILIFDEATSSLDYESEKVIQNSLETLSYHRTTLVIAHRLSTIRNARKIIVITDEGIVEQGTHQELIKQKGIYSNLYQTQFEI